MCTTPELIRLALALANLPTKDVRRRAEALARAGKIEPDDIDRLVALAREHCGWAREEDR